MEHGTDFVNMSKSPSSKHGVCFMSELTRRRLLQSSAGMFAASFVAGPHLLGQDPAKPPIDAEKPRAFTEPFNPDTLFLTYSGDPTTSICIQWIGSEWDTPIKDIWFDTIDGNEWTKAITTSKPFPMTDLKVFRCILTGLKPGTEYTFRIHKVSQEYRFRTMPAKATDAFHFVSGGDAGVNAHAVANNILAAKQDPYFIIIGGDLGYDNGRSARTALGFIRNYAKNCIDTQGRLIPLITCIGNHEVNGGYDKTRADGTFYFPLFDGLYKDTSYATLDFGDYLSLILLDTGHVAKIAGDQTDWLEKSLKARLDRLHVIGVNHVPCYPSYREPDGKGGKFGTGEEQRKHWCPIFEKYNIDAVLEHHDHTFKRTHPLMDGRVNQAGVLYLGDGSWGQLRVPKTPEKRPYLATVGGSYHFSVHRLEAEQRFHMAIEEGGKIIDICRGEKKARGKKA